MQSSNTLEHPNKCNVLFNRALRYEKPFFLQNLAD